jgi:hypothetical protein
VLDRGQQRERLRKSSTKYERADRHMRDGERKKEMRTKGLERIWVLCPTVRRSPSCYRYLLVSRNCGLSGGP